MMPPLSLYVHFPWCVRKCPYCDFNSHELRSAVPEQDYIAALLRDIEFDRPRVRDREIISVFFGGGTPSLFSGEAVAALLDGIHGRLNPGTSVEITLEANPGTTEAGRFHAYRAAGINRISIGVQSFDDRQLKKLGRIHSAAQAQQALQMAKEAGLDNINLDLMFGLPGQGVEEALRDLETAVALNPAHISWYQLTLEPNTYFYKHPPALPDDAQLWEMQRRGQALLAAHGFRQYEVSAYARPGYQCRHNLNYWQFGDYLGVGAGAHGKLTEPGDFCIVRRARHRIPQTYLDAAGTPAAVTRQWRLRREDMILEFMMNALRLCGGFETSLFEQHTGLALESVREPLEKAAARGLLEWTAEKVKPTEQGMRFLNDLLELFLIPQTVDPDQVCYSVNHE